MPIDKTTTIRERYDQTATHYDARYATIQIHKYAAFAHEFQFYKPPIIFDFGGGSGLLANYITTDIIVADISYNMLSIAKQYSNTQLIAMDGEHVPLRTNAISFLTSFSALQNLGNPLNGLREITRVVAPPGNILVSVLEKKLQQTTFENLLKQLPLEFTSKEISVEDIGYVLHLTSQKQ